MTLYLIIIVFNLILYFRTLSYGLVIDDIEWKAMFKSSPFPIREINSWPRLCAYITRLFYGCSALPLPIDHAITLSLHILTAILICMVSNPIAALLFSCHPCNHQTAIWLTGRRYSLINIILLTTIITHTTWLLPIITIPIAKFAYDQYSARTHLSYPSITLKAVLKSCTISAIKLSGLYKPMFIYPTQGILSIAPYSQPCAERHLSIPLILVCIILSHAGAFLPPLLIVLYAFQSFNLQPMYHSLRSFYNYHLKCGITPQKQVLLKRLYPELNS